MQTLRPYQQRTLDQARKLYREGERRICIVLPTGCHAYGQGILMSDGRIKQVQLIETGDFVCGPDGPKRVIATHRGIGKMVRVRPKKGSTFIVNEDHILTLRRTNDGTSMANKLVDVSVREWLSWSHWMKHIHKLPRSGTSFTTPSSGLFGTLPINPYFLGVLIGDGSLKSSVGVTTADAEIIDTIYSEAARHGLVIRVNRAGGTSNTYQLRKSSKTGGDHRYRKNPIVEYLKQFGLFGKNSAHKFVPWQYRCGDRQTRLEILAGLMDTDGSLSKNGFDFISKSKKLSDDVVFIARSLGLAAYVRICSKVCTNNGVRGLYYRVSISGNTDIVPCRIPRKKPRARKMKKDVLSTGFAIESCGTDFFYGFEVEGDGRYLLDDFTITHNSGKTVVGAEAVQKPASAGFPVLWIAHRHELVDQARERIHPAVNVRTIQGLIASGDRPPARMVVYDEVHHSVATETIKVVRDYSDALILGLTATPERSDGQPLGDVFTSMVVGAQYSELLAGEYISPCEVFAPYGGKKKALAMPVAEAYRKHAEGPTLIFCATVAEARSVANEIDGCEALDAETPWDERTRMIGRFRSGELRALANVYVLTEGYDAPNAETVILARGCGHVSTYLQIVGRVLRHRPGKIARVVDLCGNYAVHGWPTEDREYSLAGTGIRRTLSKADPVWQCKACGRCFPKSPQDRKCLGCGVKVPEPEALKVERRRLERKKRDAAATPDQRRQAYERLKGLGRKRGYKPNWAKMVYKSKFGHWPYSDWG